MQGRAFALAGETTRREATQGLSPLLLSSRAAWAPSKQNPGLTSRSRKAREVLGGSQLPAGTKAPVGRSEASDRETGGTDNLVISVVPYTRRTCVSTLLSPL